MPNTSTNKRADFRVFAAISKCWVRPESGQLPINQTTLKIETYNG